MTSKTIAVVATGDMGHAVGRAMIEHGHQAITCLAGRSERSRALAEAGGLRDTPDLEALVAEADMLLSIMPPAAALDFANDAAQAMLLADSFPVYVDCNAVSPGTAKEVAATIEGVGAPFIDVGIVGLAPGKGNPRFYTSGADIQPMLDLDGCGIQVRPAGDAPGQASAVKMCYAALTKGTWTLHTALLLTAKVMGVYETLMEELGGSQSGALAQMNAQIPRIPADSERWIGEMEEIAETQRQAGLNGGFHDGAAEIFRIMARTPFAKETRENMDRSRSLEDSLDVFLQHMTDPQT